MECEELNFTKKGNHDDNNYDIIIRIRVCIIK